MDDSAGALHSGDTFDIAATKTGGATRFSADAITLTQTINPVNDDPTLTNDGPRTVSLAENLVNAAARPLGLSVSLSDVDSPDFDGGQLVIGYVQDLPRRGEPIPVPTGEDQLSIRNQGSQVGQIGFDGQTVTFGGVAIGTLAPADTGVHGAPLVVNLNAHATPAAVEALVESLTYRNTSDTPQPSRTLGLSLTDGDGGQVGTDGLVTVTVTPENDAPMLTVSPTAQSTEQVFTRLDTGVALFDPDLAPRGYVGSTLTLARQGGAKPEDVFGFDLTESSFPFSIQGDQLKVESIIIGHFAQAGGALTITFDGDGLETGALNDLLRRTTYANQSDAPPASVTLDYTFDDGSPGNQGQGTGEPATATASLVVNIASVNDAPMLAHHQADRSATETRPFTYTVPADAFSDPDGNALSYTATLADGRPLPDWLEFDSATRTFQGTPGLDEGGTTLALRVTATDPAGAFVSDTFNLSVAYRTSETVTNPDGSRTEITYERPNTSPLADVVNTYDPAGQQTGQFVHYDDGSAWVNSYDPDNAHPDYFRVSDHYDANGRHDQQVVEDDQHATWLTLYGTADQPYERLSQHYDADGRLTQRVTVDHAGHTETLFF